MLIKKHRFNRYSVKKYGFNRHSINRQAYLLCFKLGLLKKLNNTALLLVISLLLFSFLSLTLSFNAHGKAALEEAHTKANIKTHGVDDLITAVNWQCVDDELLDKSRAGFVLSNGVVVDISFEQAIFINEMEKASAFFETPENLALVTNGEFNVSSANFQDSLIQSVIQNTLDNQTIRTINNININIQNIHLAQESLKNSAIYNLYFDSSNP